MLSDATLPCITPPGNVRPLGLYVHIPFCVRKCNYCDFNSYAGLAALHGPYLVALDADIRAQAEQLGQRRVDTIYIGGGTPTVLSPASLGHALSTIRDCFQVDSDAEVSVEANPGTVDARALSELHEQGINRLSLGVQSLDDAELELLGRVHSASDVYSAAVAARAAGFSNLSLDLIYGLPGQSLATWLGTLRGALDLEPHHLSLYCLTLEEGTPLNDSVTGGRVPAPDPDLAAEMYEGARDLLAQSGFVHYELSNWARAASPTRGCVHHGDRPDYEACRHNMKYWTGQSYLGVGAGAHSYLDGVRWHNLTSPKDYIDAATYHRAFAVDHELISEQDKMAEAMFLGLRLIEGVRWSELRCRLGRDVRASYAQELAELASLGLLAVDEESARLTPRGLLLGNQVFVRFLSSVTPAVR